MRTTSAAVLACALALAPTTASPAFARGSLDREVARAINAQRAAYGLAPLRLDRRLDRAAKGHSRAMARSGVLVHSGVPWVGGARTVGQAIAWLSRGTRKIAGAVVRDWMQSPAHRALLLSPTFKRFGVGSERGGGGTYFTADLAG